MKDRNWFLYAAITTVFWGIWGSFVEIPEKAGFPSTDAVLSIGVFAMIGIYLLSD